MFKRALTRALIAAVCLTCVCAQAYAASPMRIDVPAGSLAAALDSLAKQCRIQLIYEPGQLKGLRTKGVVGKLSPRKAVVKLLQGTTLKLSVDSSGAMLISERDFKHRPMEPVKPSADLGASSGRFARAISSGVHGDDHPGSRRSGQEANGASQNLIPQLEEVVVNATRREEPAQSVPQSITAYSSRDLRRRNITDQLSLADNTPGIVPLASGEPQEFGGFAIRGQGPAFGATPGTVAYFSDVPDGIVNFDGMPGTYFDLASVQVLKGPQGTLFGKNATGGNVLFEPQRPTDQLGGYAQLQAGDYNDREFQGALNLPIVSHRAMLRIAGAYGRREGYTKDVGPFYPGKAYDNLGYQTIRIGLLIRPVHGLDNYTIYRYYHSADNGPGTVLIAANPNASEPPFPITIGEAFPNILTILGEQASRGTRQVSYNIDQYARLSYTQLINDTSYSLTRSLAVKNIISYSRALQSYAYDYDATPDPIAGQSSPGEETTAETYYTEELRLQGEAFGDALRYVLGGFVDRQWPDEPSLGQFNYFPLTVLLGVPARDYQLEGTASHAEFTQLTYRFGKLIPALKGLSVTGGYRETHDEAYSTSIISFPPIVPGTPVRGAGSWNYGSYTLDLDYKIRPRVLVYISDRDAFKAGGFNTQVPASSLYHEFAPEKLVSIESGLKSDFDLAGMAARANLDVFHGDYADIQRTTPTVSQGVLINLTTNAARALIEGVEFEGDLAPVRSVRLSASYAYTEAKYTHETTIQAEAALADAPVPYIPRNKVSLAARYRLPLSTDVGVVNLIGTYAYQSSQSIAQTNQTVFPYMPGYGIANARLDWNDAFNSRLDVSAFVTNVTNKTFAVGQFDAYNQVFGFVTRTYGPPRMFGVQLRYQFGR